MEKNKINADEFVEKFMAGSLKHLTYIHTPIKIFPLRDIAPYLKTPIPPIFFGYNLLIYINKGYFKHQIESTSFMVQAPAVLISNYGNISAIDSVDKSAQGYCILIKEQAMTSLFREQEILNIFMISPLLNLHNTDNKELNILLDLLYKEIYTENPYQAYYESIFKTVMLKIIKISDSNKSLARRQEVAIAFKQLVHLHYNKHKSVNFYSDKLAVSVNYLNRCVSSVFKKTSKQLILEVAIIHSQLMLLETNKSVASIAYELEFDDPSYFTRLFKKIVGISPTEYRKKVN
ncbi:AraC family transcriptional regulator [Sphingobacterium cellulitidis]|uniref:helix-turn-helix domain-containing protein n=1 Tax=Sphingobacterium cellulitidis TaxID=1768011 RepID=UPI000B945D07|nr:AraC family transcriptional regulator [Sphingobacterium cellulitidis]OYD42237.1 AraC family transcriptional regulator [Sphingobacterium cellulitidis]OYD45394.1 AraC family transcriptional regulator [Sphingobacterium cellulitidis]